MITRHGFSSPRRSAFTLVELLTVIAIIALLIGILVPSLARAKDIAKKTTTRAELSAIEKSLAVFEQDYKSLPDSSSSISTTQAKLDPISGLPNAAAGNPRLTGAHWLARAMAGPDLQGADTAGYFLKNVDQVSVDPAGKIIPVQPGTGTGITFAAAAAADRKGNYLESNKIYAQDTDTRLNQAFNAPATGRLIIIDSFNWPVLYYKANSRAQRPFSDYGLNAPDKMLGVYNLNDNIGITGDSAISGANPWDFAGTGMKHGLGFFGPTPSQIASAPDSVETTPMPDESYKTKSFVNYIHEHRTHETGNVIKPVKPESFILISPGKDGLYGTDDDVNNFND